MLPPMACEIRSPYARPLPRVDRPFCDPSYIDACRANAARNPEFVADAWAELVAACEEDSEGGEEEGE